MNAAMKAPMTTWILDPVDALDSPHAGGKARALARAARGGLSVPAWVVLSDAAFLQSNPSTLSGMPEGEVRSAIDAAVRTLCPMGERLAVRSSACDEDGVQHSFAGQLASFLNVAPEDAAARVRDVWRSAFDERALRYRRERGLPGSPRPPAVILQRMVEARVAGVAFSADPVSGRRGVAVVSAVRGLGAALVSGEVDAHTWHVCRDGTILERHISNTSRKIDGPVLTDEQVQEVAALAATAERLFGCPQDIEWAIGDRLMLLQSRPITSLRSDQDQDAPPIIWDNSNIVESYSGVTTPLTFSFAREIYPPVYREFCRMMGVPRRVIARHDDTFLNVLGLVRGRLYYNLLNWYRILALLPAYRMNRRFLEQMMGVEQALPDEQADAIATASEQRTVRGWTAACADCGWSGRESRHIEPAHHRVQPPTGDRSRSDIATARRLQARRAGGALSRAAQPPAAQLGCPTRQRLLRNGVLRSAPAPGSALVWA